MKLFVNLIHVFLELVHVAVGARIDRELRLIQFVANVVVLRISCGCIGLIVLRFLDEGEAIFAFRVDYLLELLFQLSDSLVLQLFANIVILDLIRVVLNDLELLLNVDLLLLNFHFGHELVVFQANELLLKLIHLKLQTPHFLILQVLMAVIDLRFPCDRLLVHGAPSLAARRRRLVLILLGIGCRVQIFSILQCVQLKLQALVDLLQFGNLFGLFFEAELSFLQLDG